MDTFFQVILSNILIAAALAGAAWTAERWMKRPLLAHLLWLLAFVKLMCPPLLEVETFLLPAQSGTTGTGWTQTAFHFWLQTRTLILVCWLTGSVFVLISSLNHVFRFNQHIRRYATPAPEEIRRVAEELAPRLKVKKLPRILVTPARLSPLVWWTGGTVRILLPQILLDKMEISKLKWVLAHELAHISRRDHWVRWLEWMAAIVFWWNPLVYLGRDRLRANEEICCDDKVLSTLPVTPRQYASTLLDALEHLVCPEKTPVPVMASAMNSGGYMEQRLKEIIMGRKPIISRFQKIALGTGAAVILPLACLWNQSETPVETIQMAQTQPEIIPLLAETPEPKAQIIPVDYVEAKDTNLTLEQVDGLLNQLRSGVLRQKGQKRAMEETCRRMLELQMGSVDPTLLPYQEELKKQLENYLNNPAAQEQLKQYQEQFKNQQEQLKKQQQEQLRKQDELKKQLEDHLRKLQRQLRQQQDVSI